MLNIAKKTLHYLHGFRLGEPSAGRGALESKKRYRNPLLGFNIDELVISQNLAQRRKAHKVNLLILKDIFLAFSASLRENILFAGPSILTHKLL